MNATANKRSLRVRRHSRVRSEISGTAKRPRVAVFKSNKAVFVQVIDDTAGKTLIGMSSAKVKAAAVEAVKGTKEKSSFALGKMIGEKAKAMGIAAVVFDRGGFKYHGRIKAVADGMRQAGLTF